jgi:hypothetical protein
LEFDGEEGDDVFFPVDNHQSHTDLLTLNAKLVRTGAWLAAAAVDSAD